MLRRMALVAVLLALVASAALAQDEPEQAPLKPCLLAGGRTYVPVAFVEGIPGFDAQAQVTLDDVPMVPVAAAIKAAGGSARIVYEVVCPDQVPVSAVVPRANLRAWCEKHCTWKTYRCCGPCGPATYKVMTCPCMACGGPCLTEPCSRGGSPFRCKCQRVLVLQVGGQELRLVALTPGAFWKRAEVRDLIPVYRRQPVPMWPYVDCTFPHKPPFGVNWERPYLDWDPDEAWLREEMEPAATAEPGVPAAPAAAAAPATRVQGTAATGATAPPEGFTGATPEAPPPG